MRHPIHSVDGHCPTCDGSTVSQLRRPDPPQPPSPPEPPNAPASLLILVRHGQTAWSREGRHTGLTDIPLDREGIKQAAAVGRHLRLLEQSLELTFAKVLTSPLSRAVDTCTASGFGGDAERVADLVEWDYGDFEGLSTNEIRSSLPGWSLWRDGVPGGESIDRVAERADAVISRAQAMQGHVLIFAHAHILRILAVRWIALTPHNGRSLTLGPASTSILGHEHETRAVLTWNDRSYL